MLQDRERKSVVPCAEEVDPGGVLASEGEVVVLLVLAADPELPAHRSQVQLVVLVSLQVEQHLQPLRQPCPLRGGALIAAFGSQFLLLLHSANNLLLMPYFHLSGLSRHLELIFETSLESGDFLLKSEALLLHGVVLEDVVGHSREDCVQIGHEVSEGVVFLLLEFAFDEGDGGGVAVQGIEIKHPVPRQVLQHEEGVEPRRSLEFSDVALETVVLFAAIQLHVCSPIIVQFYTTAQISPIQRRINYPQTNLPNARESGRRCEGGGRGSRAGGGIIYIVKKQSLMQESEQFVGSDSDDFGQKDTIFADRRVPVLKFLPQAREVLKGKNQPYEIYSPRCLFPQELTRITRPLMPKHEEPTRAAGSRLQSMEDALYEHGKMKEKLRDSLGKQDKELRSTLWDLYGEKEPYFSRFEPASRKQNFAAVLMPIAGIVIEPKAKPSHFPQIRGKGGVNQWNNGSLVFDSHFECGNLLYVFKGEQRGTVQSYDLVLQNDVNTRGHNQWFHFKLTSTRKHQKVRINIVNLVKKESLFSYGLKPLAYSDKQPKMGWVRSGHKVNYEENQIKREQKSSSYYTLSFQYQFREAYESVYFAPSYPYSYSQLVYFMESLLSEPRYRNILTITKLCETVGKNTVNLITISAGKIPVEDCKVVWVMGRQHPVETTASFMIEGIVNHLLETVLKEGGKGGMIDHYVFKIVPMVNPDGVIHGNTRAELTGIDPNRVWKKTSKTITPTIHYIKKKILKSPGQVSMVLDLHSHSKKLGCFFYGNYEQSDIKSYRLLPSTISQQDPRFTYKNCRFKRGHDGSARLALFNELSIPHIYTVECSLLGYIKDNRVCEYKISDYHEMAIRIMDAYLSFEKEKPQSAPTAYPHESTDCCDVQSARSDSEVSDEQYAEVYGFARGRKKAKETGKNKPRSNTLIYTHKPQVSELPKKRQNSAIRVKETIKMQEQTILAAAPRSETMRPEPKREFSIKLRNNKVVTRNLKAVRKRGDETIKQEICEMDKSYGDKSVQVEQLRQSNNNVEVGKVKGENKLMMVVGSAVEEKDICVGKNEVGTQLDYSKENLVQPDNTMKSNHPSSKLKFSRKKTDLNETQLVERPSFPRPLMFRN